MPHCASQSEFTQHSGIMRHAARASVAIVMAPPIKTVKTAAANSPRTSFDMDSPFQATKTVLTFTNSRMP